MTLASWQFVWETETLRQCVGDSATKFQHSYRGVSDSPGGGDASFDVNTTAQLTGYRIGNYIYAAIGYIVFTDIDMWMQVCGQKAQNHLEALLTHYQSHIMSEITDNETTWLVLQFGHFVSMKHRTQM